MIRGEAASISRLLCACVGVLLIGGAYAASEQRRVPDTMAQRVVPCTGCHGKEGRATPDGYFPRIAGKPAGYLYNQLLNFRDGRRHYPLMVYLVEHLTDDYLREMARHFSALDLPYPAPQTATATGELITRGEALVKRGEPSRRIPGCVECHGQNLLGIEPNVPGLLGLARDYIYSQLGFWKNGERRAHAPDCMATIASRMTPDDVRAVSTWLAAQPVRPGAKPSAALPAQLSLRCGSIE